MKLLILHNSITGSGTYVIKRLQTLFQSDLKHVQVQVVRFHEFLNEVKKGQKAELPEFDALVLATWVDCFDLSSSAKMLFPHLKLEGKPFACFVCYGGVAGKTDQTVFKLAEEFKAKFVGFQTLRFISNNFGKEKDGMIETINPSINEKIDAFGQLIIDNLSGRQTPSPVKSSGFGTKALVATVTTIYRRGLRVKSLFGGKLIVNQELCEGCGYCFRNCPQNVFDLTDGKAKVTRFDDCVLCCDCVHNCCTNAINPEGMNYQQFHFQDWMISPKAGKQKVDELKADQQAK